MKNKLLALGFFLLAGGLAAQDCSELFFSEYVEGSGNNKGMEIYNPTPDIVNLSAYYVARYSNGNNDYTPGGITQLQGFLQPYSTHFLVNGQTVSTETSPACDPALQALAQQLDHEYPAPTYMNGNDAIALFKDTVGNGDAKDYKVIDLFGIVGGGMQSDDEGWAAFTNEWVYKNIYEGEVITGKDSVYIQNYIVPESYYWIPWTSNHSLVRKPSVKQGITIATMPGVEFVVTTEWDTIPGGVDVWDSIGTHYCDCQFVGVDEHRAADLLKVWPNPASSVVKVSSSIPMNALVLYDATGRALLREENPKENLLINLNVDGFSSGIYYLDIHLPNGSQSRKIVIRH